MSPWPWPQGRLHRWHARGSRAPTPPHTHTCTKNPLQHHAPLVPAFQSGYSRKARCSADNAPSTAGGRQLFWGKLALNRAPCFHFSPVAMGWAWLGQRPPYIGQGRILPPLLLMQSQRTQRRQNKQLPFSGKHISAICLLGVFCLCV